MALENLRYNGRRERATMNDSTSIDVRRAVRQRLEALSRAGVEVLPKPSAAAIERVAARIQGAAALTARSASEGPALSARSASEGPVSISARSASEGPVSISARSASEERTAEPVVTAASPSIAAPTPVKEDAMPAAAKSLTSKKPTERLAALEVIADKVSRCTRCPVLVKNRTQTVFGVGNPMSKVVFFGEAPGADEDKQGEPFVGRAGQLLNKIIEACTWKREDVYIMNVVKCRPPDNRKPEDDEVENCSEYRQHQFDIIRPQYIVCLGATAAQALLGKTKTIGQLRGKFHEWNGAKVLATYHPAYLLRNPEAKKDVWQDLQLLLKDMGIELPRKG
jgi:DNA polymerase